LAHQTWFNVYARGTEKNEPPARATLEGVESVLGEKNIPPEVKERWIEFGKKSLAGEVFFERHDTTLYGYYDVATLSASKCFSCERVAVWVHNGLVYPATRLGEEPNIDVPEDIIRDYEEARSIVAFSARGAAALLRLCIQKLVKHLGESGKNIDDDIKSLVKKGLDVRIQQALDIVRVIGNESVHPGAIDLRDDPDTAQELFRLVNLIAESMISQPRHIKAMYERLPEAKRKAIEQRDAKKT
jgi:hypothetical protein